MRLCVPRRGGGGMLSLTEMDELVLSPCQWLAEAVSCWTFRPLGSQPSFFLSGLRSEEEFSWAPREAAERLAEER